MRAPHASRVKSHLDWGDLQFFLAVADSGTIAGAARHLRVNHSTVLRRIAHLESDLGNRLFERLPGGYALTASGNALAEQLAGLGDHIEATQRRLTGMDQAIEGNIRVTSSDIVVEGLLMPLLARFRREHPGVRIHLVSNYRFSTLTRHEADVAVRGADRQPDHLVAHHVGDIETVLCAARGYLERVGAQAPLHEHRWVAPDASLGLKRLDTWFRRHVDEQSIVVRVDSLVGMADAVASGLGAGMLPRPLVDARRDLVPLAPPDRGLRKRIWVLMHPDVQRTARVSALFEFMRRHLAADPGLAHD